MNASEFYNKLLLSINENRIFNGKRLIDIYRYDAEYTPVIIKIINEIIDSAGSEYHHQNEYFRIDAIGWVSHYEDMETDAKKENIRLNPHLWDLKIKSRDSCATPAPPGSSCPWGSYSSYSASYSWASTPIITCRPPAR